METAKLQTWLKSLGITLDEWYEALEEDRASEARMWREIVGEDR